MQNGYSSRSGAHLLRIIWRLLAAIVSLSAAQSAAVEDDWTEIDRQLELEQKALEVNEGEPKLLERPPEAASHHHQNRLLITQQSLNDGWVTMYQCHSDLDAVPATQIVYAEGSVRDLNVLSSHNIGSVSIEGHSVQLKDIEAGSEVCVSADRRALFYENGQYVLRLGPFMRRFLDGYYPMRVQIEVCYPTFLKLVSSSPVRATQRTRNNAAYADIDIWVVGKLDVELVFRNRLPANQ